MQERHPPSIKYFGTESNGLHPGPVIWPGVRGLPFLGTAVPNLKKNELEQLPVVGVKGVKQFDLSVPAQLAEYTMIHDYARAGVFTVDFVDRHKLEYTDDEGRPCVKWVVHMEWTQLYVTMPPQMQLGGMGNGRPSAHFTLGG